MNEKKQGFISVEILALLAVLIVASTGIIYVNRQGRLTNQSSLLTPTIYQKDEGEKEREEITLPISVTVQGEAAHPTPTLTPVSTTAQKSPTLPKTTQLPTIITASFTSPTEAVPSTPTVTMLPRSSTPAVFLSPLTSPRYLIVGLAVMPGNTDYVQDRQILANTGAYLAAKAEMCLANSCKPFSGYPLDSSARFLIKFNNGRERVIADQIVFHEGWVHLYYDSMDWDSHEVAAQTVRFIFEIEGHSKIISEPYTIIRHQNIIPGKSRIAGHVLTLNDPMVKDRHFYRLTIAGAMVTIENLASGSKHTITSGSDGNFIFLDIEPGTYRVYASWQGKVSETATITLTSGGKAYKALTIPIQPQQVWSQPGNIVGHIVDDWENPLTGVMVSLYRKSGAKPETLVASTSADEFGRFHFSNQISDVGYRIAITNLEPRFNKIRIGNTNPYYLDSNYGQGQRGGTLGFTIRVSE